MEKELVSVIIPVYNRDYLIKETLDSIKNQTYQNFECIIVDDGSTDSTKSIVQKFIMVDSRFKYLERPSERLKGANSCRNFGFEQSKGEYINWFDSDDIMHKEKIERQVLKLKKESSSFFTVCQTMVFKNSIENTIGLRAKSIYSHNFFDDFVANNIKWLTQAPLFKRKFLLDNNLKFDESLHQSQERDFFIRMLDIVDNYSFDNTALVYLRHHDNNISNGKITSEKLTSNFKVNYRTLVNFKHKISKETKVKIIRSLKVTLLKSLEIKNKNLEKKFFSKIYKIIPSFDKKISFIIGFFLMKYTKKGYSLYIWV